MKLLPQKQEQGGVLVVALITCFVIATVLASYLWLISNRFKTTVRSMDWSAAMPVLEAGVEEAMTHLQSDTNNPSANNWTATTVAGQPVYTKRRDFADGSYFSAVIHDATSANPIIYSSGFVRAPLRAGHISRTVRVMTTRGKAFPGGISANGPITLSGGAIIDSYNSCNGAYSTNNSKGTNTYLATNFQGIPAIKVGTGHVYGRVKTGPLGTVTFGGGAVGDAAWNATSSGLQPGWGGNDMNVAYPTNSPPAGGPFVAPTVDTSGGSNVTVVNSGTYQMASFTSSGSTKPMFVFGTATLYVTGNFTVSGSGYVKIFPGANLTLIIGGTKATISGGGVVNSTQQPANFSLVGLTPLTDITYSGSAAFTGTINAPQADMTISGSGGAFGAMIVKSYLSSGGSSFHYDECLFTPSNFLTVTSWREL